MKKLVLALILIAVLGGGGYYLWDSDLYRSFLPGFLGGQPAEKSSTGEEEPSSEPESDIVKVTVEGKAYSFTPSTITVSEGDKVRLTFKNTGSVSHDFVIDELDVNTGLVSPGSSITVEFDAPRDDLNVVLSYEFYCSVPGHKEAGMKGTLVVE